MRGLPAAVRRPAPRAGRGDGGEPSPPGPCRSSARREVERAWHALAPRLAAERGTGALRRFMVPLALAASLVAGLHRGPAVAVARPPGAAPGAASAILLVAVGDHLERSEMLLVELVNAPAGRAAGHRPRAASRRGSWSAASRLYRAAVTRAGEPGLASVLEELERLLVEVAHRPSGTRPGGAGRAAPADRVAGAAVQGARAGVAGAGEAEGAGAGYGGRLVNGGSMRARVWVVAAALMAGGRWPRRAARTARARRPGRGASEKENARYEAGTAALDEEQWDEAVERVRRDVAAMGGRRADAALYWKAYGQRKAGPDGGRPGHPGRAEAQGAAGANTRARRGRWRWRSARPRASARRRRTRPTRT